METKESLLKKINKAQTELAKLRVEKAAGKIKNVHLVGQKRQALARLKTALRQKELNEKS